MFIAAQLWALSLLISGLIYFTMRAANYAVIKEDSERGDWQLRLCAMVLSISYATAPLAYGYYNWFWFIRLEITFAKAAESLRVSKFDHYLINTSVILTHIFSLISFVWANYAQNEPVKEGKNSYGCNDRMPMSMALALSIGILSYLIVSAYLCYSFISRFRKVMLAKIQDSVSSFSSSGNGNGKIDTKAKACGFSEKEQLIVRKTAIIGVTTIMCSTIILFINALFVPFLVYIDIFLNTLFIAAYFQFGKSLYDWVFCLCEKNSDRIDRCCGVSNVAAPRL